MAKRTYRVSRGTECHKLDSPSATWIAIPPSNSLPGATEDIIISDVQTVPGDADKVFICGFIKESIEFTVGFPGIAYSHDGGTTWNVPSGGNYLSADLAFIKLWVVNASTIYVTNVNGLVFKSTDYGVNFNACTQIPAYTLEWHLQGETWTENIGIGNPIPLHFRDPVWGIVGLMNAVAVTEDAGVSWVIHQINTLVSGEQVPGQVMGVHIDPTGQEMIAVGQATIEKSYDAGLTWIHKHTWSKAIGLHLTWTDDDHLFAFGTNDVILRSDDSGDSWQIVKVYDDNGPYHFAGHFWEIEKGYYSSTTTNPLIDKVMQTLSGCTPPDSDTWNFATETRALWTDDILDSPICFLFTPCDPQSSIEPFIAYAPQLEGNEDSVIELCPGTFDFITECTCFEIERTDCLNTENALSPDLPYGLYTDCIVCGGDCFLLTNCADPQDTIVTNEPLGAYVGSVILIEGSSECWIVSVNPDCADYESVKLVADVTDCSYCIGNCYTLTRCDIHGQGSVIVVNAENNWLEPFIGLVIQHPDLHGGHCYTVTQEGECRGEPELPEIQVNSYNNCICCTDTIYVLVDCRTLEPGAGPQDGLPDVYTNFDCYTEQQLGEILDIIENGGVIQFEGNGICWKPDVAQTCPDDPDDIVSVPTDFESYEDCDECLAIDPVIIPQNIRRVKPGYDTPGCPPEFTEKVSCKFANAMYNQMTVVRYGVKMCCDLDIERWAIKMEQLKLKAMYDATMCASAVVLPGCPPEDDPVYPVAVPVT